MAPTDPATPPTRPPTSAPAASSPSSFAGQNTGAPGTARRAPWLTWLAVMAAAYSVTHHNGFALARLGYVGDTRWADWIDVATPYTVLLPAAAALHAGGAATRHWTLYLIGATTYAEGHGVHLSANSVGNVAASPVAHLWDEYVGHYLWYGGLVIVLAVMAAVLAHRDPPRGALTQGLATVLAVSTGLTFTTNALEGHTAVPALAVTAAFACWGYRTRRRLGRLLLIAFAPALLTLAVYGLWHGGYPPPSELGRI